MVPAELKTWHCNYPLVKICYSATFSISFLNIPFFCTVYRPKIQPEVSKSSAISSSVKMEESSTGGLAVIRNVREPTKDEILGNFEDQQWHTIWLIALAFILVCGLGGFIVYQRISKGILCQHNLQTTEFDSIFNLNLMGMSSVLSFYPFFL